MATLGPGLGFGGLEGASAAELGVPLDCRPGVDCFVQQQPDFDPGPGAADPFCGGKTYDGHDGTDIRVLSMAEVARGVPVLALGDGRVLRGRDGVPDRLAMTAADRAAVADRECGNGLVLALDSGMELQYCHLKRGSVRVKPGEAVAAGDILGMVGASGDAQFPHVHVTVRGGGEVLDPATGRALSAGCLNDPKEAAPLWSGPARDWMARADTPILSVGLSGSPPDYDRLVEDGPPPELRAGDAATVGWGWFANLQGGDRVRIVITAPDGAVFSDETTAALPRAKAAYLQFAGRKRSPAPGSWRLLVEVLRGGGVAARRETVVELGG